jgi:hypothetical protein
MVYSTLDSAAKQVRLLHLHPGSNDDKVSCTLRVVSLDDKPEYEALSYVWGDASDTVDINVQKEPKPVTKNLCAALMKLRFEAEERVLWVDALCINQLDIPERSQQVRVMAAIYSQASRVVVYLGATWDGYEMAFEAIRQVGEDETLHFDGSNEQSMDVQGLDLKSRVLRDQVKKFYQAGWWSRIWTVQEFVLAKQALICCGACEIPGQLALRCVKHYMNHITRGCCAATMTNEELDMSLVKAMDKAQTLERFRQVNESQRNNVRLLAVLVHFQRRHASDARDKVYGLLGLGVSSYIKPLEPDYSKPVEQVYQEVAMLDITESKSLLCFSCLYQRQPDSKLPSWTPDWFGRSDSEVMQEDYVLLRLRLTDKYNACADRRKEYIKVDQRTIRVTGVVVDNIAASNPRTQVSKIDYLKSVRSIIPNKDQAYAETAQSVETALQMTMCGGLETAHNNTYYRRIDDPPGHFGAWERWEAHVLTATRDQRPAMLSISLTHEVVTGGRCFVTTAKGYFGFAPTECREGDVVVVLYGGRVPYVLRPIDVTETGSHRRDYVLLGDAYIHGIMDGEAFEGVEEGDARLLNFDIV